MNQKFINFTSLKPKVSFRNRFSPVVSVVVVLVIGASALVLSQRIINPVGKPWTSRAALDVNVSQTVSKELSESPRTSVIVYLSTPVNSEASLDAIQRTSQRQLIRSEQEYVIQALAGMNYKVRVRYKTTPMMSLEVDAQGLERLKTLKGLVTKVQENQQWEQQVQQARKVVAADKVEASGWTVPSTSKLAVVVVDAGVDKAHPFLAGKVVDEACFGDNCISESGAGVAAPCAWESLPYAGCNHGTFVSGVVAGGEAGVTDRLAGIAPDIKLIAIRASSKSPYGDYAEFRTDYIMAALDWVNDKVTDANYAYKIAAVNLSLSVTYETYGQYCDANFAQNTLFKDLRDKNIAVVFSAMNEGAAKYIGSPACHSQVIAVGSTEKNGQTVSTFSNAAPFQTNYFLAPGGKGENAGAENIKSSGAAALMYETYGTSFAAPQVAAAFAIMKHNKDSASLDEMLGALKATATMITDARSDISPSPQYPLINIEKAVAYLRGASLTSTCALTNSSTFSTCVHNPGGVLGASTTSDNQVLAATNEPFANMALVTIFTSPSGTSADSTVQLANYCGEAMTKVNSIPSLGGGMKTEMWYLINPLPGRCEVYVQFTKPVTERVISSTVFNNVATTNPVVGVTTKGSVSTTYTTNPTTVDMTLVGPKDSLMVCGYTQYSEQTTPPGGNNVTALGISRHFWKYENHRHLDSNGNPTSIANIWGGIIAGVQRTSDNQSQTLSWRFAKTMPWSTTCANFKVKPFVIPSPPPTPPPVTPTPVTPSPSPTPVAATVNIKANNSDGPVILAPNDYGVTISWTSSGVSACTGSGGVNSSWGTTATSGSMPVQPPWTNEVIYTLRCTTQSGTAITDRVTVRGPYFKALQLSVNGPGTTVTIPYNTQARLSWLTYNIGVSACTASNGWTGSKAVNGNQMTGNLTTAKTYTLTCGTTAKSVSVNVAAAPATGTLDFRINGVEGSTFLDVGTYPAVLTWNYGGTATCTASGHTLWTGSKAVAGTQVINMQLGSTEFVLTCGNVTKRVYVSTVQSSGSGIPPSPTPLPSSTPTPVATPSPTPGQVSSGITGTYYPTKDLTGKGVNRIDPYVQFYWSGKSPIATIPAINFSARWTGALIVPTTGSYTFYTEADDGIRLYIDEQLVLDKWTWALSSGIEHAAKPMNLTAGKHKIRVDYTQSTGGAKAIVRWSGPGITKRVIQQNSLESVAPKVVGARANYFNNEALTGVSTNRIDPAISFNWGTGSPFSSVIPADRFSVRWTGYLAVETAGSYRFYTEADDGIRVWVDGVKIMDYWWWQSHYGAEKVSGNVNLSAGVHAIQVEAHDGTGGAKAVVRWSGPNTSKQILPLFIE